MEEIGLEPERHISSEDYYLSSLSCSLRVGKEEVISDGLFSITGDLDFPSNLEDSPEKMSTYCWNSSSPPGLSFSHPPNYLDQQDIQMIENLAVAQEEEDHYEELDLTNEGTYIREVLIGPSHPRLPIIEGALGSLSGPVNTQLLYDAVLYSMQAVDVLIMELIKMISLDPANRRLQAGLDLEAELMETEGISSRHRHKGQQVSRRKSLATHCLLRRRKGRQQNMIKKKTKGKREKTSPASQKLLKEWLFSHSRCPYPTEDDKQNLCQMTGLSLQQLNNWFINARRRILPQKKTK